MSALYRSWGAAIWRANARLRLSRLEAVGVRGRRVQAYAAADAAEPDQLGAPGLFDDRHADVGGGFMPGGRD